MTNDVPTFRAFALSRHRLMFDGEGVTTLVGGYGCPLACRYCINGVCTDPSFRPKIYTVPSLYDAVKIDSLYFEATGGGVTFGGGEPLLQAPFLAAFIRYAKEQGVPWRFSLETSLAVPPALFDALIPEGIAEADCPVDAFIADIKDMDPAIYERYTKRPQDAMRRNLGRLAALCPDRVTLRVPLIPGYNTEEDCDRSEAALRAMGFSHIDRFRYVTERPSMKRGTET